MPGALPLNTPRLPTYKSSGQALGPGLRRSSDDDSPGPGRVVGAALRWRAAPVPGPLSLRAWVVVRRRPPVEQHPGDATLWFFR